MLEEKVFLVVYMEAGEEQQVHRGEFCCRSEPGASLLEEFSKSTEKFLYSRTFVSIAVLRQGEKPCASPAAIYGIGRSLENAVYAILNIKLDRVLGDIEVVAPDDYLQIATEVARRWKRGARYESQLATIQRLRGLTRAEKLAALFRSTRDRGLRGYSEARLFRCLGDKDVERWGRCL
jgi:hypothetical protein